MLNGTVVDKEPGNAAVEQGEKVVFARHLGNEHAESAHEYVQVLADKLREWKKGTTQPYKPGVLASALEEENYRAARFYMLRKVYKKLALSNQKADAIRRDLESVRRELAICTKSQKQTEQALSTTRQEAAEQGAKLAPTEQALVAAREEAAEQGARLARTEQALADAREKATEQGARLARTEQALAAAREEAAEQGARLEQALATAREESTELGQRLSQAEQALVEARQSAMEQGAKQRQTEQVLTSTRKELAEVVRIQTMIALMPRLMWRYQLLRIKKVFSFGAAKQRFASELRKVRKLVREYRVALDEMNY